MHAPDLQQPDRFSRKRGLALLAMAIWLFGITGETSQVSAERLKAAFVFKFTLLVTWPDQAFESAADPLAVCILGSDAFAEAVESAVAGRRSQGRTVTVSRVPDAEASRGCHVLYVAPGEVADLGTILLPLEDLPTLTIGEAKRFVEEGGMIRLRHASRRIYFDINRGAAQRAGLHISSKLLQLAKVVHD